MRKISKAMGVLGSIRTERKAKSSAANGKLGGRPRQYPKCDRYNNKAHRFSPTTGRCACGFTR